MRHITFLLLILAADAGAAENHCSSQEQVIFSCSILKSSKVVSICASKKLTKSEGTLVYRFGPLGKPDLEFPSEAKGSPNKFRLAHYFRYQVDRPELSFDNGEFTYTVFDYYDGTENPPYARGVRVSPLDGKGKEVELRCSGKITSSLNNLEGIVSCDEENALASCN